MLGMKRKYQPEVPAAKSCGQSFFSTHAADQFDFPGFDMQGYLSSLPKAKAHIEGAQDDSENGFPLFKEMASSPFGISEALLGWYGNQGFIGHQLAAIIAQNWLVNKACSTPAKDAVRNGYSIVTVDGDELDPDALKILQRYDRQMRIKRELREFIRKGRIFGIRIAMFKVESTDKEYYSKPFNIDGVTKGSYKGIVQVDPYWTAPQLDQSAASAPDSLHFYEPTWWIINGRKVHRSHLVIYRHDEPTDILKPQYLYGGIPLPQQIMERVYAAERVANEAPELAMTKRTNVWLTDYEKVMADPTKALNNLQEWVRFRNNYGVKLGDKGTDEFAQFDTSLADFDAMMMSQYQLAAAIACMPSTKLLGTSPKGFGASGEYEEASYHELLETIEEDVTPFLERHHALTMRSYVDPALGSKGPQTTITWNPLDAPTAKEQAETNFIKAQTGQALQQSQAIDGADERRRVATDPDSGYHGLGLEDSDEDGAETD